ncbi:aspartate aminotransferase family protein [Xylocopilactobacillus apicola]|uniref:Aspartate aminotransferase family protein n=1 Tax=Xylocopilactobacillus apicola TaxID=2932184 RepID=A0AAU9DA67_9LACO|nr:aspartate aminotransferase family protein [Xylocopilactobacillus apicola]BDR58405.1 aspartate aminotransferase family protein [Xylocopilactobacillus apicola]
MELNENQKLLNSENKVLAPATRIQYFDLVVASGKGAVLTDLDGKEYVDLLASASATNTGHSHPHVVEAICQQAKQIIQYTPAYFANEPAARLATRLAELAPISGPVRVGWGNSGSDANDAIIKYARAYTKRPYIVSFTGAYHGSTYGSISISAVSLNMSRKIGPLLPDIVKVPYPDPSKKPANETLNDFVDRYWEAFKLPFETYLPVEEVAAIIIEPIQGDGGIIKAPDEYMQRLYKFAHDHGILFAIDEVNQGLGRTGKWWSIQHFNLEPDIMTVGKSIASGLPLSAVIGRAEILDSLDSPANTYTTAGNPVTTAAANATLDVIENEHLVERSEKLGKLAQEFFDQEKDKYDFIGDVRFYGLNGGVDIVDPQTHQPDSDATNMIIYRMFELGVVVISLRGYTLRIQPPLVITEEQLQHVFTAFKQTFSELAAGKLSLPENADQMGW